MKTSLLRVLVVDDEPGIRGAVSRILEGFKARMEDLDLEVRFAGLEAATGEAAISRLEGEGADLLLLDLKLPGVSGLEVLGRTGGEKAEHLTVVATAYATLETVMAATRAGAWDFLVKPYSPEELRAVLRRAARHLLLQREARQLAAARRRERFELLSVLAHELKAPINAVEGYLRMLADTAAVEDPALRGRAVERSLVRLDGMRKLITDLLDMTRIESGMKVRTFETVDVREILERAMETVAPEARRCRVDLAIHGPDRLPFRADRGELEIVANNLLSNAVKYNRDGGRVDVRLGEEAGGIRLEVSDTGIGLTAEETSRLFRDFSRIRGPKTQHVLGSGLGLATVRKLAHLYDGEVFVDSVPDQGSTFTVVLREPADAAAA